MKAVRIMLGALALWLATAGAAPGADVSLKVLTLNVLEDVGTPSASNANAWRYTGGPNRRDRAVRIVAEEAPDIAGLQEAETNQVADFTGTNVLASYAWFGAGRTDGQHLGQHELILYRADRFTHQDAGVFWLSLTPDVPGSQYPGAALPRIAVWVRLLDRASGRPYLVVNTHWDYASAGARLYSAQLMRARLAPLASNRWVVLTGDFNMTPTDPAYATLLGASDPQGIPFRDAYRQAVPVELADESTRNNFRGDTKGQRIDLIFHAGSLTASAAAIVRTTYDAGRYPSDHYPVTATLHTEALQPVVLAVAVGAKDLALTWSSASGLPYRVYASADLRAWQPVFPAAGVCLAAGAETRCSIPLTGNVVRACYRVTCWPHD